MQGSGNKVELQLEVSTVHGRKVLADERPSNYLVVNNLLPGTRYNVTLTAVNKYGQSRPVSLTVETFLLPSELSAETKVKEEAVAEGGVDPEGDLSVVRVAVVCGVLVLLATSLMFALLRLRKRTQNASRQSVVNVALIPKKYTTSEEMGRRSSSSTPPLNSHEQLLLTMKETLKEVGQLGFIFVRQMHFIYIQN